MVAGRNPCRPAHLEVGVSAFERQIADVVRAVVRDTGAPARTLAVAGRLYLSDRQVRRYLAMLEARQAVRRVGQRGGWLPA